MNTHTRRLVLTAVFAALIILFGLTPIGMINLGFIYVTILCVPVIIGTLLLGLPTGLILSSCFASVSFFVAMTRPSALAAPIVSASVPAMLALCFLPRLLIPLVVYYVHLALSRTKFGMRPGAENAKSGTTGHLSLSHVRLGNSKAVAITAIAGSMTNTICYLGLMLILYHALKLDATAIIGYITVTATVAGLSEASVAAIISAPVVLALHRIR